MRTLLLLLPLFLCAKAALACELSLQATNAWARPGNTETAVYFDLKNTGDDTVTLTEVSSPSGTASLHESMNHEGTMHMEPIAQISLKPGETLSFAPGKKHVMLEELKKPLKLGDKIKLTLFFADDSSTTITIPVANKAVSGEVKQQHQHH